MLRVSSHRRYVVGTFAGQSSEDVSNTYNVTNFKDYGLLQVFYPTRGILEWYNRATGKRNGVPFNEGKGGVAETHQFPCAIEAAKYALNRAVAQNNAAMARNLPFHSNRGKTLQVHS